MKESYTPQRNCLGEERGKKQTNKPTNKDEFKNISKFVILIVEEKE